MYVMDTNRRKAGRPKLPPDVKRSERATVWLTREERAELEADAGEAGETLSAHLVRRWREGREEHGRDS